MIELLLQIEVWVCVAAGLLAAGLAALGRKPSLVSLGALALVELALIVQLVISIVIAISGGQSKGDIVEFFGYIITALLVPLAAGFWALVERTRWSTLILGVGALTVAVMLVRMWQIWTGSNFS